MENEIRSAENSESPFPGQVERIDHLDFLLAVSEERSAQMAVVALEAQLVNVRRDLQDASQRRNRIGATLCHKYQMKLTDQIDPEGRIIRLPAEANTSLPS